MEQLPDGLTKETYDLFLQKIAQKPHREQGNLLLAFVSRYNLDFTKTRDDFLHMRRAAQSKDSN